MWSGGGKSPFPLVFSTLGSPGWSLERAAEQAVADGYAGLEVRILDGQIIPPDLPAERRAAIRSLMKQHGLVIAMHRRVHPLLLAGRRR